MGRSWGSAAFPSHFYHGKWGSGAGRVLETVVPIVIGDVEEEEEGEEEALPCGDHKVYHPSAALKHISYGHRVRLDAAIKWV
ncbi:hypothetical protein RI054_19g86660 [Pseudoscourfieldia marina]